MLEDQKHGYFRQSYTSQARTDFKFVIKQVWYQLSSSH